MAIIYYSSLITSSQHTVLNKVPKRTWKIQPLSNCSVHASKYLPKTQQRYVNVEDDSIDH